MFQGRNFAGRSGNIDKLLSFPHGSVFGAFLEQVLEDVRDSKDGIAVLSRN
jgi:hypothetical protein